MARFSELSRSGDLIGLDSEVVGVKTQMSDPVTTSFLY